MKTKKLVFISIFITIFIANLSATEIYFKWYVENYKSRSTKTYAPSKNPVLFDYGEFSKDDAKKFTLKELCDEHFPGFEILGTSSFTTHENAAWAQYKPVKDPTLKFAKKIGADIVVTRQYARTYQTTNGQTTTSTIVDADGNITTAEAIITNQKRYYNNEAFFLRNVNNVDCIWQKTKSTYKCTPCEDYPGLWNNSYGSSFEICETEDSIVGFFVSKGKEHQEVEKRGYIAKWNKGDLIFIVSKDTRKGIILNTQKAPLNTILLEEILEVKDNFGFPKKQVTFQMTNSEFGNPDKILYAGYYQE